jgi:hypothetical protein
MWVKEMTRAIVNVATGRYLKGQERLIEAVEPYRAGASFHYWQKEPEGCPAHSDVPYAFKAFALKEASKHADILLWCDACILPIRSLEPLWERIERDGYWISRNGYSNAEWTAESAYPDLFELDGDEVCAREDGPSWLEEAAAVNKEIPHVVATAFGLNVKHPRGKAILAEYYRLASETRAFCGPWKNTPETPCGPEDVRGHRHDQSALSVLAWRNRCTLTNPPNVFSYKGGETAETLLVADGAY